MKHRYMEKDPGAWLKVPVLKQAPAGAISLDTHSLLIYAFLVHRARRDKAASQKELRRVLGMDSSKVAKELKTLAGLGLAVNTPRGWRAELPSTGKALFQELSKPLRSGHIGDTLCYVRTYLPTTEARRQGLTHVTALLYWRLVAWADEIRGTGGHGAIDPQLSKARGRRKGLSIPYLVRAMRCDPKTIRRALNTLCRLGLIRRVAISPAYFSVGIPVREEHVRLWKKEWAPTPHANLEQLLQLPAAAVPTPTPLSPQSKYLMNANIPGSMHQELLKLSEQAGLELYEWKELLLNCKRDNDRNRLDNKSEVPHPGGLFRYELKKRIDASGVSLVREANGPKDIAIGRLRRLPGSSDTLVDLVITAITQGSVDARAGGRIPCPITWQDVPHLLTNADFNSFRQAFAGHIFTKLEVGVSLWLDQWLSLRPLPQQRISDLRSLLGKDADEAWNTVQSWHENFGADEDDARVRTQEVVDAAVARLPRLPRPSLKAFLSVCEGHFEFFSAEWYGQDVSFPTAVPYNVDELIDEGAEAYALHVA